MPAIIIHPADSPQAVRATTGIPAPASLSAQRARLGRMVGHGCFVRLADASAIFSVRPAADDAAPWSDCLYLDSAEGQIEVADGARLIQGLTGIHIGAAPAPGARQQWFAAALAGRLAGTPLAGVQIGAPCAAGHGQDSCCLRLSLRSRNHMLSSLARAPLAAWLDFLSRSAWRFERAPAAHWLAAEHRTTVQIAQHTLPGGFLRKLAPGDVIVPDSPRFGANGEGRMRLAHLNVQVRYAAPNSIEVLDVEKTSDH